MPKYKVSYDGEEQDVDLTPEQLGWLPTLHSNVEGLLAVAESELEHKYPDELMAVRGAWLGVNQS